MADLGRPDFEILRGFVIVARQRTEGHFQIGLPRHIGQLPEVVCSVGDRRKHRPCLRNSSVRFIIPTQRLTRTALIQIKLREP